MASGFAGPWVAGKRPVLHGGLELGVTTPLFPPRLPGAAEAKVSRAPFQGTSLQMHSHLSVPPSPHIPSAP